MADVAYPGATGIVGITEVTTSDSFVPELWSDEIRAAYEKSLVMTGLIKKLSMKGKKGDTVHVPAPTRGTAYAKSENTAVTIQANTEGEVSIVIDKHFEYSRLIEDIVKVQALDSLRQFYTQDAGYALAKQKDSDIFTLLTGLGDGTYASAPSNTGSDHVNSATWYASSATALSAYAVDTVTTGDLQFVADYHIRALIQKLDDNDVPMDDRYFVVPPALTNQLRSIDRFVSSDFVNSGKVPNGKIGNLYGVEVYTSTNCPTIEAAAQNAASTLDTRGAVMFHRDAFICAEQMDIRSQTQYKQEYLANLYTADTLYGVKNFRTEAGVVLAVPNS